MIYFDHSAATPLDPDVLKKMQPYMNDLYGNPSSIHEAGRKTRAAVGEAREKIAAITGVKAREVLFTSGGTEANNWAVFGVTEGNREQGKHVVSTKIEHESVLEPLKQLEIRGYSVTRVGVDGKGLISLEELKAALKPETILASIIYANNEIGTVQDMREISRVLRGENVLFHTDACQAPAWLPINVPDLGADLMTLNSGKIGGPRGAGALIIRGDVKIAPLLFGGGQEFRMRAGTENVAAIVGFAEALEKASRGREAQSRRVKKMRDNLISGLTSIDGVTLNGDHEKRLPNNVNVFIEGVSAESLLVRLDMEGIAASAGSACGSGSMEPSHVLQALGLPPDRVKSSIRLTLGKQNTDQEITDATRTFRRIVEDLRGAQKPI